MPLRITGWTILAVIAGATALVIIDIIINSNAAYA